MIRYRCSEAKNRNGWQAEPNCLLWETSPGTGICRSLFLSLSPSHYEVVTVSQAHKRSLDACWHCTTHQAVWGLVVFPNVFELPASLRYEIKINYCHRKGVPQFSGDNKAFIIFSLDCRTLKLVEDIERLIGPKPARCNCAWLKFWGKSKASVARQPYGWSR